MATLFTTFADHEEVWQAYDEFSGSLNVLASLDSEAFAAIDDFLTGPPVFDAPIGGEQTVYHRTGTVDGDAGTFHIVGSALDTANPKINGLIFSDASPAGSTLVMTSTAGMVVPAAGDNFSSGAINGMTWE